MDNRCARLKPYICELAKNAGFADAGIADDDDLEQIFVIVVVGTRDFTVRVVSARVWVASVLHCAGRDCSHRVQSLCEN